MEREKRDEREKERKRGRWISVGEKKREVEDLRKR